MNKNIVNELKRIIKSGESFLRELKGDFAVPGTVRKLTKEFLQFSESYPEIYFQVYSTNGNTIIVDLKDLYMRLPEDLQHIIIGEEVAESSSVYKLSNKQKELVACIAMRPEGVPSSFVRPMIGRTCDPKTAIKPAIEGGFVTVKKEKGINFFIITDLGREFTKDIHVQYNFINYVGMFPKQHPELKNEWELFTNFLIEGDRLKVRCPIKRAISVYKTGLFKDVSDGNDQSITLSEFGAWFRLKYLNQLDELTKP